jgi:predicted peptidase
MLSKQQEKISSKGIKYLLYLPNNYQKKRKYPLILFLHGSEERGNNIKLIKRNGLPKLAEHINFQFIIVSPQCSAGRVWKPEPLIDFLHEIIHITNADEDRIYGTGLSLGAYGIWELAISYPFMFAAIAPICGGGNKRWVKAIKDIPVWVFHGARDKHVPLSESVHLVRELKKCGGKVKFTIYPDAGHDVWTISYEKKQLYKWFLKQNKKKKSFKRTVKSS